MLEDNLKKFSAIINDWDFFIFLQEEHYQAQMVEKFGKDKKHFREKIKEYNPDLIKKIKRIGRKTYFKDTDVTIDIIKYIIKYEFIDLQKTEIDMENEIKKLFKRIKSKNISKYIDATKDFEAICGEKILKLKTTQIKTLTHLLTTSDPKKQKGKEHLLFGLLNMVEKLNDECKVEALNNYFDNLKDVLGEICLNGISNAEEEQVISNKCRAISISILVNLNRETGINTIFDMIEKIPEETYSQSDFLQSTLKSELKKIIINTNMYNDLILNRFNKSLSNPNKSIRKQAEELKNFVRKDLV
jgi:hypothetical protein